MFRRLDDTILVAPEIGADSCTATVGKSLAPAVFDQHGLAGYPVALIWVMASRPCPNATQAPCS